MNLVVDIGGTNIRLYLIQDHQLRRISPKPIRTKRVKAKDIQTIYSSGEDPIDKLLSLLILDFLGNDVAALNVCILSVCGVLQNESSEAICLAPSMGKTGWIISRNGIAKSLNIDDKKVLLYNDFICIGYSLVNIPDRKLVKIYDSNNNMKNNGNIFVMGPGTGLGTVQLLFYMEQEQQKCSVIPSESGMCTFTARDAEDWELRQYCVKHGDSNDVVTEQLLSGEGMVTIYQFFREKYALKFADDINPDVDSRIRDVNITDKAEIIVQNMETNPLCKLTVEKFVQILGSECKDNALRFRPSRGIYLAGGFVSKILPLLTNNDMLLSAYLQPSKSSECYKDVSLTIVTSSGDDLTVNGCWEIMHEHTGKECPTYPYMLKSHDDASLYSAKLIIDAISKKNDLVLCVATGNTPTIMYSLLKDYSLQHPRFFSKVKIVKLDEWYGLPMDHPATCEHYIQNNILIPLDISSDNYLSFKSDCIDPILECKRIENELLKWNGIDFCILGLGVNGHLGFNEPHVDSLSMNAHLAVLTNTSQQHSMLKETNAVCTHGLTLGMDNLLSARESLLLVTGENKKDALWNAINSSSSSRYPASVLLRQSKGKVHLIYDQAAEL